tara:strand:- start:2683 stop:3150 length:468 start_codon:yes stop_codon:yes gene_type:complete
MLLERAKGNNPQYRMEAIMANIFQSEISESVVDVIKRTMQVSLNDQGQAIISFATNRGKGTGAQSMLASDFAEYVSTLEHFVSNGVEEVVEENLSPAETVRATIQQSDGTISFRVRSGKGAKPAKIPAGDFAEVVSLLRSTVDAVMNAAESVSAD